MVAPLVVGALRVVAQKSAGTAARSRVARATTLTAEKSGSERFMQKQSLSARATKRTRSSASTSPQPRIESYARSRISNATIPSESDEEESSSTTQNILGFAANIRLFTPLLPSLIFVSILLAITGIFGLLMFFIAGTETTVAGSVVKAVVSAASPVVRTLVDALGMIAVTEGNRIGLIFIGLSFVLVIVAYPLILIYLAIIKGLKPLALTGIPFVAFIILPIFDIIPGLNIFPWLILWAFILCTAPKK